MEMPDKDTLVIRYPKNIVKQVRVVNVNDCIFRLDYVEHKEFKWCFFPMFPETTENSSSPVLITEQRKKTPKGQLYLPFLNHYVSIFETFTIFAYMETKGQNIRRLRKEHGLSQSEIGALCGMNKSQISKIENDKILNDNLYDRVFLCLGYKREKVLKPINFPYKTEDILKMLKDYKEKSNIKIEKLGLYGSCARNEQTDNSDIDIAIKLSVPSLLYIIQIENELKQMFKTEVNVISLTSKFLPGFFEEISKDMIYV